MNLKKMLLLFGLVLMLTVALPLCAQTGCTDSPEDPTLMLALVAGAGALAAKMWRLRNRKP